MSEFLIEYKNVFDYLGDVKQIAKLIARNGYYAKYEFIKIAAECF